MKSQDFVVYLIGKGLDKDRVLNLSSEVCKEK